MTAETGPSPAGPDERSSRVPSWLVVVAAFLVAVGGVIVARLVSFGFAGKTVWDYLDLLIVPAALALVVYRINRRQTERDQQAEEVQRKRELAVENERAQDTALEAYLGQMSELLLGRRLLDQNRDRHEWQNLAVLARARTLTVLARLDGRRKRSVLQFLYESGLINKDHVVVDLRDADLSGAKLQRAFLKGANLSPTNEVVEAYVRGANLSAADLKEANLIQANLEYTDLVGADLKGAVLYAADLKKASLVGADLKGAIVAHADLGYADLTDALGLIDGQLATVESFEGATMPDGQKIKSGGNPNRPTFEEWRKDSKDKEGRKEHRETSSPS